MLWKKTEKKNEFDEINAETWGRILSFINSSQGTEATAHNIIMNETPAQLFSSEFTYRTSAGDCF